MPAKMGYLVIDAADPAALAGFWCGLLAVTVDAKLGKNRVHLDLVVDDLDQSTAEVEKLSGRWLEPGNTRELEGFRWRCMADPRATNSTSTSSPARRQDIRTELRIESV